jgi:hypothetical protein
MPTPKPWGSRLKGILHVLSAEDGYACRHHLLCLGIDLNKAKGHSADGDANGVCDLTTCQCEHLQPRVDYEKEIGALTVIAHPNSGHDDDVWLGVHADCEDGTSLQDLQNTTNYTGIEIFNAGSPTWSDAMWDEAMSYSPGNRTTWCFAADDCHDVALNKKSFNRGWIIVNSDEAKPTQVGVIDAIRSGNFYSVVRSPEIAGDAADCFSDDDGPIMYIAAHDTRIMVMADRVCDSIKFIGGVIVTPVPDTVAFAAGMVLKKEVNTAATVYTLGGYEKYVRVVLWQTRSNGQSYAAYSQPLYVTRGITGRVLDETGFPLAEFSVTAVDSKGTKHTMSHPLPLGQYRVPLVEGTYTVTYDSPAFVSQSVSVTVSKGFTQQIVTMKKKD